MHMAKQKGTLYAVSAHVKQGMLVTCSMLAGQYANAQWDESQR